MNIKQAIIRVFSANFLNLLTSLIIGFIVPIVLSIEGYAELKTYTLYMSYIGLLHFGLLDGMYIKYGGKRYDEIDKSILKYEHNIYFFIEFVISIIFVVIGCFIKNIVIVLFGFSILPFMIQAFHKYINQATGKFKEYTRILVLHTISYFLITVFFALVLKSDNYIYYCCAMLFSYVISMIVYEIRFIKDNLKIISKHRFKIIVDDIKVGFFILLGNLIVVGLFGLDKIFVKSFFATEDFAYYSFAVSMLNIINVLVNAISITFYNYLFKNNYTENINRLKKYLIVLGGLSSMAYFVLSFIVTTFIKKYIPSLDIIAITFSVFPYMILINALYVNLYKVNKEEKHYFKVVLMVLLISIVYNCVALFIFGNARAIAYATLLTLITWVIYSSKDLKNVNVDKKMYIYMFGLTISFLLLANNLNYVLGGIIYIIIFSILTVSIYKDVLLDLKNDFKNIFISRINNK